MELKTVRNGWPWTLIAVAGALLVVVGAAFAISEGYAADAEMRAGNGAGPFALMLAGLIAGSVGVVGTVWSRASRGAAR